MHTLVITILVLVIGAGSIGALVVLAFGVMHPRRRRMDCGKRYIRRLANKCEQEKRNRRR